MSETKTNDFRKKLLVEPILQKKIIWNFFYLGISITLINLISFYFLISKLVDQTIILENVSPVFLEMIQQTCLYLIVSSLVTSLFVLLGFCVYGLYFSNRIAGPIYNVRKSIGRILQGEKGIQIQFRKDDYFQELSEQMNLLLEKQAKENSQV